MFMITRRKLLFTHQRNWWITIFSSNGEKYDSVGGYYNNASVFWC